MARIGGLPEPGYSRARGRSGGGPRRADKPPENQFENTLVRRVEEMRETESREESSHSRDLQDMLEEVDRLGKDLVDDPGLDNVKRYRQSVGKLLKTILGDALAVQETSSGRNILRRKKFSTITVINDKLEKLAATVIESQREQLELLRRVEEINGLLVDLLQ